MTNLLSPSKCLKYLFTVNLNIIIPPVSFFFNFVFQSVNLVHLTFCQLRNAVVVQTIGNERYIAIVHTHIASQARQFGISVVIEHIAVDELRIALHNTHMSVGRKRVLLFVEIGAVAIEVGIVVPKAHIAFQ